MKTDPHQSSTPLAPIWCTPSLLLAACLAPIGSETGVVTYDSAVLEDSGGGDSNETGDSAGDSGRDTGEDTAAADPSTFVATVTYGSGSFDLACSARTGVTFEHTYDDALGNTAGRVRCLTEADGEFQLTFTSGGVGQWSAPDAGVDYVWIGMTGERLGYYEPNLTPTAWTIEFSRYEQIDARTIQLEASFSGTFVDSLAAPVGSLSGTISAALTCTNCP